MPFSENRTYRTQLPFFRKNRSQRSFGWWRLLKLLPFVFAFAIFGQTMARDEIEVGGTLTQNEVWTNEHTYIVVQDLRIPDSVTLVIEAGVTVKVNQGRGIFVLGGNLRALGQENDSVKFFANTGRGELDWKWKGISYTGSVGTDGNGLSYVHVSDAEIAVDMYNSEEIIIENSCFVKSQNIGVRLFNSRNCLITNCLFQDNYDGIELVATYSEEASGNTIDNSVFRNENHNIYLLKAYGGILINNLVTHNLIEGANNGIWLDNGGGEAFGRNTIRKNIIMMNGGEAGYGLMIAQDSMDVQYNIFWKNHIAVFYEQETIGTVVTNNSFYQNQEAVNLSEGSMENSLRNNTFSMNNGSIFNISEAQGTTFVHNNLFAYPDQEKVVTNNTPDEVNLSDNFWNTDQAGDISKMIWDREDDPALGEVVFTPFLSVADTTDPVVPPLQAIKQQVGNTVKVSWLANPEEDLRTYKLYYGKFEKYSFPLEKDTEGDTVVFLTDFLISDTIAVTALDSTQEVTDAQVSGHESPFAFADIYPFAGADGEICKMHDEFPLEESTVPFAYDNINWSTGGDGTFNDPQTLHPVYYPGISDKATGKVVLTISVLSHDVVKKDSLTLYIFDDPVVFAGNDTTLFADEQLTLSEAYALYYETVQWTTTGDGIFDNDTTMHPVYYPGEEDVLSGEAVLVFMAESDCGSSYDTLHLFLEPFFSVEGNLWHKNIPVPGGVVLAMQDKPGGARAVELAQAENDGYFIFHKLTEGDYYLYAVPDTLNSAGAVPGYYAHKLRWQEAWYFRIDANTYDVDIMLPSADYLLPDGEGSVSGYFTMPVGHMFTESIFCASWFEQNSTLEYCDDGLSNMTVFLYNSSGTKLLAYTLTDENGNFYFRNLPYGGYIIDAEKAGYETTASSLITLSPEHKHETGVEIELTGNKKIGIHRTESPAQYMRQKVYPNPANNVVNLIVPEQATGAAEVNLYNLLGQQMPCRKIVQSGNTEQPLIKLDISKLPSGMYIGRIIGKGNSSGFTFIKK